MSRTTLAPPPGTTTLDVRMKKAAKAQRRADKQMALAEINLALGILPVVHVEFEKRQPVRQHLRTDPARTAQRKISVGERRAWLASIADLYRDSGVHCYKTFVPVPAEGVKAKVRALVHLRATRDDRRFCERCSRDLTRDGGQVHHRRPRAVGGSHAPDTNIPSNLLYLCAPCHQAVESYREISHNHGWLAHQGSTPADLRVLIDAGRRWVWLTADGGYIDCDPEGTDR